VATGWFRKSNKKWALAGMIAAMLVIAACGQDNPSQETAAAHTETAGSETNGSEAPPKARTVTDGMGHEVTIPAAPERIIASYLEDHLTVLGVKPVAQWSVANGIQDYLQAKLQGIPTLAYDLPPEAVAGFTPDFIIVGSSFAVQNGLYEQYSKIAPTYVLGDDLIKDWRKTLLKIGELLNKSDEAAKAVEQYDNKAAGVKAKLEKAAAGKSAAILWLTQKQFYMVDDKLSSGTVLYGDLGMAPPNLITGLPDSAKASWNPVTMEKLAELDADYIFLVNSDKGQDADTLNNPIWKNLPAVKLGQVFEMSTKSSWLYSGAMAGSQLMDDVVKALKLP
jgi:iron complex transport system substrate-binding protein